MEIMGISKRIKRCQDECVQTNTHDIVPPLLGR